MGGVSDKPDHWISIREAAELAKVKIHTMRRRLHKLNSESGGRILRRFGPGEGKISVSAEALLVELRTDPNARAAEIEALVAKIEEIEGKQLALRNAHRSLRKEVRSGFAKQARVNQATRKAIEAVQALAAEIA